MQGQHNTIPKIVLLEDDKKGGLVRVSGFGVASAITFLAMAQGLPPADQARAATLGAAVETALRTNPKVLAERAARDALAENHVQAKVALGPSVSISANQRMSAGEIQGSNVGQQDYSGPSHDATLRVSQPLYAGGRLITDVRIASEQIRQADERVRQAEIDLVGDVATAYANLRRDEQLYVLMGNQVASYRAELGAVETRLKLREATKMDLYEVAARVEEADARMITFRSQLESSRARYTALVGSPPDQLEPEGPLSQIPDTLEAASAIAVKNNARIKVANGSVEIAKLYVERAKASGRPNVSLEVRAGDQALSTTNPQLFTRGATASINVTMPLLAFRLNASKKREAQAELAQRLYLEDDERRTAVEAASRAWNGMAAAQDAALARQRQTSAALASYKAMQEGRAAGIRTIHDVLQSQRDLFDAQISALSVGTQVYTAKVELLRAIGALSPETVD